MPYAGNADLPETLRRRLPPHAQDIFRETFNAAWARYADRGPAREATAHRIAWAAVQRSYVKQGDIWVPR